MDLRTGPGRFRKVMWYDYSHAYGNDLCDNKQGNTIHLNWEEAYVAEFVEFFGRLYQC